MDLKISDVAELLKVSETTIRRWLSEEKIPAYKISHQYRFNRQEIENWVLSQKLESNKNPLLSKQNGATAWKKEAGKKTPKGGIKQFSLYRAIHKGLVLKRIEGKKKEDVIRNTMKQAAAELNLDPDVISELLLDRESLQPTSLGNGIGIPHTRDFLLNANHDAVLVAFLEKPIPYGALDGKPVHTLFFLFACDDKRHLHLLAKIAHLSKEKQSIDFLRKMPGKEQLLEYVKNWENNINELVKDSLH